jgi:hypothetical protein
MIWGVGESSILVSRQARMGLRRQSQQYALSSSQRQQVR